MDKEIECQTRGWDWAIGGCLGSIVGYARTCGMPEHILRQHFERAIKMPASALPPQIPTELSGVAPWTLKSEG